MRRKWTEKAGIDVLHCRFWSEKPQSYWKCRCWTGTPDRNWTRRCLTDCAAMKWKCRVWSENCRNRPAKPVLSADLSSLSGQFSSYYMQKLTVWWEGEESKMINKTAAVGRASIPGSQRHFFRRNANAVFRELQQTQHQLRILCVLLHICASVILWHSC